MKEVNNIVRYYTLKHTGTTYQENWNKLYKAYNAQTCKNIKSRATRLHLRPLEVINREGDIDTLIKLAKQIFVA